MRAVLLTLLVIWDCSLIAAEPVGPPADDLRFLQNDMIKLGIRLSSGGAVAWFSLLDGPNLINDFDRGRLLQQSFYGDEDGSQWGTTPWRWNPVQGGGYRGESARVLQLDQNGESIFVQTLPKHWATGKDLPEVVFEQWIRLSGPVAQMRFRMTYEGEHSHAARDQEIPALFVDRRLATLVTYDGSAPWSGGTVRRIQPGFPNEYFNCTEHWAAWIGPDDLGIGIHVPQATRLTCYRVGQVGEAGSCSYVAPLATFAVVPKLQFEYHVDLTAGTLTEIRERFRHAQESAISK